VNIALGYVENSYRVEYLHQQLPKVSILIPTKDKLEYLQPCVESLLERTDYPDYEVLIIDNQSAEPDTLTYYEQLLASSGGKVRVLYYDKPFNFSDMNNWAAEQAQSDYLLLMNNDTEVIQADWLSRLMNHGLREDVGVVGARLVYPGSGKLQHAGVYLGLGQIADHPYNHSLSLNETSHMERARLDQNLSAVTAAVMLVRKSLYQQLGGMDAANLKVLFNDVDLCLRATEAGYRVVWTPFSVVVHHGSVSLKNDEQRSFYFDWGANSERAARTKQEQTYMFERWLPLLANDPFYNQNLSLRAYEFNTELNAPLNWELWHHLRLRCFGVPINGGSGEYRMRQPFNGLAKAGLASCEIGKTALTVTELARLQADTVVFQNAISDKEIDQIRMYREFYPQIHVVFLLDDLLHDLPEKSSQYKPLKAAYRDARSRLRKVLSYCDRLIVSTEPLRELCQDMIDDIVVIPNRLEADKWTTQISQRGIGKKPRVGWAGAQQHQGDLELIVEVVKETANEVDWIFFGMCPDEVKPYIAEEHHFVPIDEYPAKLASLNLDLAIAPLEQHDFNKAKSNLRLLEYGIMGWPVICSDIYPYQTNNAPVIRVQDDKTEWVSAIRQILADPVALAESGEQLRLWVRQHYILEEHLDEWLEALKPVAFAPGMPVSPKLAQA
jgi:GT2 family glycosyltransferase